MTFFSTFLKPDFNRRFKAEEAANIKRARASLFSACARNELAAPQAANS